MQVSVTNNSDLASTQHAKHNLPVAQQQATQVENKKTEFVENSKKSNTKLAQQSQSEKVQKNLKEKNTKQQEVNSSKRNNENFSDVKLERNIAETKIAEQKLLDKKEDKANASPLPTIQLEASKTYGKEVPKKQTALEVATSKADILKSVKTVRADGTEEYHFPVPIEILAKLPPPGNIGISASKMAELIGKNKEKDASNTSSLSSQPIEITTRKNFSQEKNSLNESNANIEKYYNLKQEKTQNNYASLDYGFG